MTAAERTQVVISGAGPVGTVAAYLLAQHDIDVIVLESSASCESDMRASTFHAPTLSFLNQLGIAEALISAGLKAPLYQYRIRATDEVLEFDLGELDGELEFPFRLQCEQYKLARMLAEKISQSEHGQIRFEHRVSGFTQDDDGVTVVVDTPAGPVNYRCDYLIAADGARSTIRRQLNVDFSGFTYHERFLTLSTDADLTKQLGELCYVNYVSDPDDWYVLLKVPSTWRILVPVDPAEEDAYTISDERKNKLFDKLLGGASDVATNHRTIYRVHQRVASNMSHQRVVLAGDAAHLNNPLGGFGMNGGIHDAWNLGLKLIEVYKSGADANELLARYDRQRRAVMNEFVQTQSIRNKRMIEEGGADNSQREWDEMRAVHADEAKRREFLWRQSMQRSLESERSID